LDEKNLEISSTTNHKYGIRGETQWYQARKWTMRTVQQCLLKNVTFDERFTLRVYANWPR
jgi:hypothetical protein